MHGSAAALAVAAAIALAGSCASPAAAQSLIASPGWQLEYFGADVAVLRTTLTAPASGRTGQLLLSCDGGQRRVRLVLPDRLRLAEGVSDGTALLKPSGSAAADAPAAVGRFTIDRDRVLSFIDVPGASDGLTLHLARILKSLPRRLEILLHYGRSPITIRRVSSYAVAFAFDRGDSPAFQGFISVCTQRFG